MFRPKVRKDWRYLAPVLTLCLLILSLGAGKAVAANAEAIESSLDRLVLYYNQAAECSDWETLGLRWAGVDAGAKHISEDAASASDYARRIMGGIAANGNPQNINGAINTLVAMQNSQDGSFVNGGNSSLNQTIWAVIALDFAELNGYTVGEYVYQSERAREFICGQQDSGGGFDESGWGVDVDSTAHALIALAADYEQPGKDNITAAVDKALAYLRGEQLSSGAFGGWGSESPDSTAAVIEALLALGKNPQGQEWLKGSVSMVDALLAYQSEQGWFASSWAPDVVNSMTSKNALLALSDLGQGKSKYRNQLPGVNSNRPGNGGSGDVAVIVPQSLTVTISIRGDNETGTILAGTSWNGSGSCTALDALEGILDQKGISYNSAGGYVKMIAGLAEKKEGYPLSGWLFRINGAFPGGGAESTVLSDGDQVEWLFTLDGGRDIGAGSLGLNAPLPGLPETDEAMAVFSRYEEALSKVGETNLVINEGEPMAAAEIEQLREVIAENKVDLSQTIGTEGGILEDSEILLKVPENALNKNVAITVKEVLADDLAGPALIFNSAIYDFGPDGSKFDQPVTIAIKLALTDDIDLERLAPAWYDDKNKKWIKIPALIDLKNGLVVFKIDHFTYFALIEEKAEAVSDVPAEAAEQAARFDDIGEDFDWARPAIEALTGAGIIKGTDHGFEPARNISRAEMLALLLQAQGVSQEGSTCSFNDVEEGAWFYQSVATAAERGWASGYPDFSFRPNEPVSRSEAACLIRAIFSAGTVEAGESGTGFADDDDIPGWAREAAGHMRTQGIMKGYPDGSFGGTHMFSRAEAAVIVYNLLYER